MEIPYTVKARPDTGLWNAKIAIWLFLASEVMLFGGLFSAYIFLRVGSDSPWPTHVLDIKMGFINTLLLIFSSITVLQAWLSLKMRNYNRYVIYMIATLACATIFMVIKLTEYGTKLHHYGVRLQDGSVLEGHLPEGYQIKFKDVKKVTLTSRAAETGLFGLSLGNPGSDGDFLGYLVDSKPTMKDEAGKDVTLDSSEISKVVSAARHDKKNEIKYEATQPLSFSIPPAKLASYDGTKAVFRDGTVIEGKLEDDTMRLRADKVDLRLLISDSDTNLGHAFGIAEKADAWRILGPEWQEAFVKHRQEFMRKNTNAKAVLGNADLSREAFTMSLELKEGGAGSSVPAKVADKGAQKVEAASPSEEHKASAAKSGEEPDVSIQKSDIAFYSNFTPKYHNYYALYFALTSLHGLHIVGGAIVLGYFLLFGRKLYDKDPEHLTNRVEVGGLFWHFVDVVWMVLFPVLYLM